MAWAKEMLAKPGKPDIPRVYAQRFEALAQGAASVPTPVQVLRIGDVCIGSLPNEIFCEIGLEFRKRSPVQPAFLVELAHGYFDYLPTPEAARVGGVRDMVGHQPLGAEGLGEAARRPVGNGGRGALDRCRSSLVRPIKRHVVP